MTCPYITVLERACRRPATHGDHCELHMVLAWLDSLTPAQARTLLEAHR